MSKRYSSAASFFATVSDVYKRQALSNLVYAANGGAVCLTMVDGRVVYRDGVFLTLDIDQVRAKVSEAVKNILAR